MDIKVIRSIEVDTDELQHYGIKGMRWGVRRYQNKDGSLTNLGKKRMYSEMFDNESKEPKEQKKYTADANRWVKEDMTRSKRLVDESTNAARNMKNLDDTLKRNKTKQKMDLSNMSDKELRDQINRAFLEKQYNDMFAPPTVSKGRENVGKVLEVAGSALAVTSSALGIALAIKELRG